MCRKVVTKLGKSYWLKAKLQNDMRLGGLYRDGIICRGPGVELVVMGAWPLKKGIDVI